MSAEPNTEIEKLIKALINQQFHDGNEIIYGRTKEVSVKIPRSGLAINKLYAKMLSILHYFNEKNYLKYVKEFNENVLPIDADRVYTKFRNTYDNAAALEEPDPFLIGSMLFSEILESCREKVFNKFLDEMRNEIIESKKNPINDPAIVNEKLKLLYSRNDKDISITYNLVFLKMLADSFDFEDISKRVQGEIKKRKKRIMRKIIKYKL